MPSSTTTMRAIAALLLLSVIWGYNWIVMKVAMPFIGPFQFGAIRTFFAALLLFAALIAMKRSLRPAHLLQTTLIGVLQTTGFTGLIIWALVEGGAGKTAVLTFTMPFWVMLLAWPLLGEKLRGLQWLAAALAVSGLLLILEPWNFHGKLLSNGLAVLAGVSWALAVILAKQLHHRAPAMDLLSFTAWQMLIGSLPLVALAYLIPAGPITWSTTLISSVLFNVILANGLGWLLWLYALRGLPAGVASMNSLLIPVIAVLAASVQLGEIPSTAEAAGMLLVGAALLMLTVIGVRKHEEVEAATGQE